jgi:mannose-6-phosphate isomerase-like protein (cupin superfamily)
MTAHCKTGRVFALLVILVCTGDGADVQGFKHYPSGDLKAKERELAARIDSNNVSFIRLDDFGTSQTFLVHRAGSGDAELHDHIGDYFVVQSGSATLVVGGQMKGARVTEPGESRGSGIDGGNRTKIGPGDIVHIPSKQPHQLLIEPGRPFTYVIIKVKE